MNRDEKAQVIDEIADRLGEAGAVFAVDYRGISVTQAAELRARLRENEATFTVVKNRLAKRAAEKSGTEGIDALLQGPTALALVKGDPVTAAKTISTFARENDVLVYKGGLMDGAPLDPESFSAIARLPGLDVLRGQLVGLTASPITGLARGLNALVSGIAIALGQIAEKGLVSGEAPAAEPESAAEEAADKPAGDEPAGDEPAREPAAEEGTGEEAPAAEEGTEEEAPAAEEAAPVAADEAVEEAPVDESAEEPAAEEGTEEEGPAAEEAAPVAADETAEGAPADEPDEEPAAEEVPADQPDEEPAAEADEPAADAESSDEETVEAADENEED